MLSMVRIFPNAANQVKDTLALLYQTLFQEKWEPSLYTKALYKDLTFNNSFLEGPNRAYLHFLVSV